MIPPSGSAAGSRFVTKEQSGLHSNPLVSPPIPLSRDVLVQRCASSGITCSSTTVVVDHTCLTLQNARVPVEFTLREAARIPSSKRSACSVTAIFTVTSAVRCQAVVDNRTTFRKSSRWGLRFWACTFQGSRFNRTTHAKPKRLLWLWTCYTRAVSKPTACVRFSAATKSYRAGLVHTS